MGVSGACGTSDTTSPTSRRTPATRRSSTSCITWSSPRATSSTSSNEFLIDERELSPFLSNLMHELAQQTSPMSMLRTSISAASAYDPDGWDETADAQLRKALRLIAKTPTLIANYHRLRTGQDALPPNPKLPHTANFLWMLLGDEPSAHVCTCCCASANLWWTSKPRLVRSL